MIKEIDSRLIELQECIASANNEITPMEVAEEYDKKALSIMEELTLVLEGK